MTDLIIFLVFIIAMTLFTGMIQAIQIEKLKERVRCLKISNEWLESGNYLVERADFHQHLEDKRKDELASKQSEEINLRGKDF